MGIIKVLTLTNTLEFRYYIGSATINELLTDSLLTK